MSDDQPPTGHRQTTVPVVRKVPHRVLLIFWLMCLLLPTGGIGIGMILGRSAAFAIVANSQLWIGSFCFGALACALAGRAMRLIFQPIDAVTEAAFAISEGNLDQVTAVDSRDNFGQLAQAFNALATRLRHDRAEHELELRRLRQAGLAVVDCFAGPALIVDREGGIKAANAPASAVWGSGHIADGLATWSPPAELAEPLSRALQLGEPYLPQDFQKVVRLMVCREERSFLPRVMPLFGDFRVPIGAVVVLDDVTRFRLLDEMQSDFVAAVSHESKTPLTSIRLAIYLLLQGSVGELNAKQTELLIDSQDNLERMLHMIENLLNHSLRLEQERNNGPLRRVTGNAILEAIAAAIHPTVLKSEVDLVLEPRANQSVVQIAFEEVVSVAQRLLEHILRLRERPGRLTIRAVQTNGFVTIAIKDSAAARAPARSVNGFFRLGRPSPEKNSLGFLAAMRQTIHEQGGELFVDEQHEQDTRFELRFPVYSGAAAPARPATRVQTETIRRKTGGS